MKYKIDGINWSEAPIYDPWASGDRDDEIQWQNFLKKYHLPENTTHPQEYNWYMDSEDRWCSLSLLATPEAVKLYRELIKLEGIVDDGKGGDSFVNDDNTPIYHFRLFDKESETYIQVKGLGGDKFKVDVHCRNLPNYRIQSQTITAQQIKDFVDDLYEDGINAFRANGFDTGKPVSGGGYGRSNYVDNKNYSQEFHSKHDSWPDNWYNQDDYVIKDKFNKLNGKYDESLSEAYVVKFGYDKSKPEQSFDKLEDAIKFINDGMKKKESKSYTLFNGSEEMIWLDEYRDANNSDVGYTVSRHNDKSIEFDKSKGGLAIKQQEVKHNEACRKVVIAAIFAKKEYKVAQVLSSFKYVEGRDRETSIDFDNKIVYYNDSKTSSDGADDLIRLYKEKNESLNEAIEIWYKQEW